MKLSPVLFTIFGITGDLTQRKLLPALYNLEARGYLPQEFYIIGFARRDWSDDFLKNYIRETIAMHMPKHDKKVLERLVRNVRYVRGNFNEKADFIALKRQLEQIEKKRGAKFARMYYLAAAPSYYPQIFEQLGQCGLSRGKDTKILIEKPFGRDLQSARELTKILLRHFKENQVYRIDHYLAKSPVQNILSFRFANGIFEHLWSNKHIESIEVSASMEQIGIEHRGMYYEETGALLDVVQNHVMQLISLICMEEPRSMSAEDIRSRKHEVLKQISADPKSLVRGQYTAGEIGGKKVPGYREEENVSRNSKVETFAALKLNVNAPRWKGVPFYVRTGKRLDRRFTEINIQFKQPHVHFLGNADHPIDANILTLRIQPEESISLRLMVRKPDLHTQLQPVQMDFCYSNAFNMGSPEAYQNVLYEAFHGSQMLFVRSDSVLEQWRTFDQLAKNRGKYPLHFYKAGSRGPAAQDGLVRRDGRKWWSEEIEACPFHERIEI